MKKPSQREISERVRLHVKCLQGDAEGVPLDASGEDWSEALLTNVDLFRAKFNKTNLSGANFSRANLDRAQLSEAELNGAIFIAANLFNASLIEANLTEVNFFNANLHYTNLGGANLSNANLENVNLFEAILLDANLKSAELPAPTVLLLAEWYELSPELTSKAIAFNASCHPDPSAFTKWANGGPCPYEKVKVKRACVFWDEKEYWDPDMKAPSAYELMTDLIREKCANSDFH